VERVHDVLERLEGAASHPDPAAWESLARRPDEPPKSHAAFLDYVRLGPGRSLRTLHAVYCDRSETGAGPEKPPTKRLATLKDWSARFAWQARLKTYHQERQQHEQAVWETRRQALREADFTAGDHLRELVAQILAQTPQFLKTTRRVVKGGKGQPDREVVTLGIDLDVMLKALKLASELQRQAADIPQQLVLRSQDEQGRLVPMTLTLVQPAPPPQDTGDGGRD